jgi:HK97 family phage major capsid protein
MEVQEIIEKGLNDVQTKLEKAVEKFEGQLAEKGKVDGETKAEVKALSENFEKLNAEITALAQKQAEGYKPAEETPLTAGQEFVKSEDFKAFADMSKSNRNAIIRLNVKNTVLSDTTTVFPTQKPGVIQGDFAPVTIRQVLPSMPVSSNMVNSLREDTWNNSAQFVAQGGAKPESDITFEQYNVPVETVAHWIKVSNQLLADAPAIAAYIDRRARDGLAQEVDRQLLLGNGTTPNLSGLTDSGNFTAYSAVSDDLLVDAINRAKYQLWAIGRAPDTVIVNPADWGAMERTREGANSGMYLYGLPGQLANVNPFGVRIVMSNFMPQGSFLIGALQGSTMVYNRQGATVEMGYVNDDFTKNLVTIRVEERLGLGVERPTGILYGAFSA